MSNFRDQLLSMKREITGDEPSAPTAEKPRKPGHIVRDGALSKTEGRKRFYFEARDDRVTFVEVNDATLGKLERGDAGIAEAPAGKVTVIERSAADALRDLDATWLRFPA